MMNNVFCVPFCRVGDDKLPKRIKNQNKHKQKRPSDETEDVNPSKQMKAT